MGTVLPNEIAWEIKVVRIGVSNYHSKPLTKGNG